MSVTERRDGDQPNACPACAATSAVRTVSLDVVAQHKAYFPFEPDLCDQLSRELTPSAPRYDLLVCMDCRLVFASPMRAPGSTWYELAYRGLNVQPEHRWEFDAVLANVTPNDSVYEIGCGPGAFLDACRARRIPAQGVDFSEDMVRRCRARGLNARVAGVGPNHLDDPASSASVVAAFHVLEHLPSPVVLFHDARRISGKHATLWVSVPSDTRVGRVCGYREPLDEPPHHLTKWTKEAFEAIGTRHGWRLESLTREPFSWRNALWTVASQFRLYRALNSRGWLKHYAVELPLRATLYPVAALMLMAHPGRRQMSGLSMLARYSRLEPPA